MENETSKTKTDRLCHTNKYGLDLVNFHDVTVQRLNLKQRKFKIRGNQT